MIRYLLGSIALISTAVFANTISTPGKAVIGINAAEVGKRVCYYQDKAYSDGAILQVGPHYMICTDANDFETNGALKWVQLQEGVQVTPQESDNQSGSVKRFSVN